MDENGLPVDFLIRLMLLRGLEYAAIAAYLAAWVVFLSRKRPK